MTVADISVIIPVYNGERYLREAVESIRRQGVAPREIIIVDDGSTDTTATLAVSLGADVRYHYQANRGPAAARNQGLRLARGSLLAFLDADDMWADRKLRLQLPLLESAPHAGVVMGRLEFLIEPGYIPPPHTFHVPGVPIAGPKLDCGLFRRGVFEVVGLFNESFQFGEDVDWYMRARGQGIHFIMHDDTVHYYRQHDHNMTRDYERMNRTLLKVFRASVERRKSERAAEAAQDEDPA